MIRSIASQLPGESPVLDAQILLSHITGHNRTWLISHPEETLSFRQEIRLERAIRQLQDGLPLPYVLGHWEFFGLDFYINPNVLIPRPETELIVETVLAQVRAEPRAIYRILDVGTGSGIIPVSLAVHLPQAYLTAIDISPAALSVAQRNAERYGVSDRITFIESDLIPASFDLDSIDIITANLPYIPIETLRTLDIYGKEPTLALDGGDDGLTYIRRLIDIIHAARLRECLILLEIEQSQGAELSILARHAFPDAEQIRIQRDLAGYDRMAIIKLLRPN